MSRTVLLFPLSVLLACGGEDRSQDVQIQLAATVAGQAAACGESYTGLGSASSGAQLADARLFLSDVQMHSSDGAWVPVDLEQTSVWQHENVVLLDFEDGTAACADSGTSDTNTTIVGTVAEGSYDGFRANLGVPFELNHQLNTSAPAPLNAPGMFWVWQGGYKFVRVDWMVDGGARWNVHLGSTACASSAPTEAPTSACARPNLASIEVMGMDPTQAALNIDLAALVADADISTNTSSTPPGCMSSPMEPNDCGPVFGAVGLDFASGSCTNGCSGQKVFTP